MAQHLKHLLALLVCALIVATSSMVGFARAEDGKNSVAQARKRVSVAADGRAAAEERVDVLNKRAGAAEETLEEAEQQRADSQGEVKTASRAKKATARKARAAASVASDADQRWLTARAAVMRLARSGYVTPIGSMDLLLLTNFLADGSASLGDFSQQLLAQTRVQERLIDLAEMAEKAAESSRARADDRAEDRKTARGIQKGAEKALAQSREDVKSARSDLKRVQSKERAAEKSARKEKARYKKAQSSFKEAFLDACSTGGGPGTVSPPPASSGNQAKAVWDILLANGFTEESAAGVLGNLQQESNIDPTTMQNGGPGMGLAQWTFSDRWQNAIAFANTHGWDVWSVKAQVEFMLHEMRAGWFDLASFRKMTDIAEATVFFHDVFERSADSSGFVNTIRVGYAQSWYMQLTGTEPVSGDKPSTVPALTCPGT